MIQSFQSDLSFSYVVLTE